MDSFSKKFEGSMSSTLECFDRVIFKGHLPFHGEERINKYVDHVLGMKRKDFLGFLSEKSEELVAHGKAVAEAAGRPYEYQQGFFRKEAFIDAIIRRDKITEGLVAVLCVQETCPTVKLIHGKGRQWHLEVGFVQHDNAFTGGFSVCRDHSASMSGA